MLLPIALFKLISFRLKAKAGGRIREGRGADREGREEETHS